MYSSIPFWKFALGAGIVCVPLLLLENEKTVAWAYVFLILLTFAVYHYKGLQAFSAFIGKTL